MLNGKGKLIAPFKYSALRPLGEDIYLYVEEGDHSENSAGLMNSEGKHIIPPIYNYMEKIFDGLIPVNVNNDRVLKWGYLNKKGEVTIGIIYDEAKSFVRGHALVQLGEDYLLIDTEGKVVKEFAKGNRVRTVYISYYGDPVADNEEFYREYDSETKTVYFYNYKGDLVNTQK